MFSFAFLIEHARELHPQLVFDGKVLGMLVVPSDAFLARLADELPRGISIDSLTIDSKLPAILVDVDDDDERRALLTAFHQASIMLAPYSLISPTAEGFDFSRRRPRLLPNALLLDYSTSPPHVDFRYQSGPSVLRMTIGPDSIALAEGFNERYVRMIARLYPPSLLAIGSEKCELATRIARSLYWFSQGEGQRDTVIAFVCLWIGLEGLVLRSSNLDGKRRRLVYRLGKLVQKHSPSSNWDARLGVLWDSRSDVVHEGLGGAQAEVFIEIGAGDLNDVKYLFYIALLYVLERHLEGVPLEDLWNEEQINPYTPTVTLTAQEVPALLQSLMTDRRSAPAEPKDRE